jgi:penicillin-binding protein 1A
VNFSLKKAVKISFWIGLAFALSVCLFIFLVWVEAFGAIPNKEELTQIKNANATLVYSADEVLLGQIFEENRTNTAYDLFPQSLINALVATEDARFFEHDGIDERSLLRVLVKSILLGDRSAGGGSTLTQQLAKNLFGRGHFGFMSMPVNKTKELILAQRLEALYSKEQILELYLNTVSFSENTYGIAAGSRRFFGKAPQDLRVEESAVLVGLLKANTYYNPRKNPEHAIARRNTVLHQMRVYGYLEEKAKDSLQALPLTLDYINLAQDARAPYFLSHVKEQARAILEEINKTSPAPYVLEQDGLRIYTTLDYGMQQLAEEAVRKHLNALQPKFKRYAKGVNKQLFEAELKRTKLYQKWKQAQYPEDSLQHWLDRKHKVQLLIAGVDSLVETSTRDSIYHYIKMLQTGVLALEPRSGAIKVWVGGLNQQFLPYDHVLSKRQAASTFKPIVYATALEQGIDPCSYFKNEQRIYPEYENWSPANYDHNYGGYYSMQGALKKSINVVAVQTIFDVGINNVLVRSRALGIESKLPAEPSVALGTASVSLMEMTRAYGAFANEGMLQPSYLISRIEAANGTVLYEHKHAQPEVAMSKYNAEVLTAMLEGVVNEGTGTRLRSAYGIQMPLAGKTGTAQNYTDGWFIGYTPKLVCGVWVGASSPSVHFTSGALGSGSAMALPVFGSFMKGIERNARLRRQVVANFSPLSDEQREALECVDFKEGDLLDDFLDLFDKEEGEPVKREKDAEEAEEKPNFFQRLFGKKR